MEKLLLGKNAIITGCARGMGHKMMEVFAEHGANLWVCARKQTEQFEHDVKDLSEKHQVNIIPIYFELTDGEAMKLAVKQIMSFKQPIDILVIISNSFKNTHLNIL